MAVRAPHFAATTFSPRAGEKDVVPLKFPFSAW